MQKFSKWLINEAISGTAVESVNKIVKAFLAKKLGAKVYCYPELEGFANSTGRGYGVRYFYNKKSIRFNWKGANISSFTLDSVDLWDGTSHDPNWHMEFGAEQSLVKTLPLIIDLIKSPFGEGTFYMIPDDISSSTVKEEYLAESTQNIDAFDFVIKNLKPDTEISSTALTAEYGSYKPYPVLKAIIKLYPHVFKKVGRKQTFIGTTGDISKIKSQKDAIISQIGGVKVTITKGGSKETYAPTPQEEEIESEGIEKVAYKEQLRHLAILVKLVIKGASNALFVAGRGGTGKTTVAEIELAKAGLHHKNGYFKLSGTASPIGVYMALYDNKDGIILFDDCDSALADQEGRNLIKAATDTKEIRKVSWNKKSSIIVPEDIFNNAESDVEDGGRPTNKNGDRIYPNSFDFSGQVIFISNLVAAKLDPDGALRTRGFIIDINPTDAEMIDHMETIAPTIKLKGDKKLKQSEIDSVMGIIKTSKSKNDKNLRKLVRGLNVKSEMKDDPDCKDIIRLYA